MTTSRKTPTPSIAVPADAVAIYEALAWNKAVTDRAKHAVARAETVLTESLAPGRRIEDQTQPRYVTVNLVPAGETRKAKSNARELLVREHPEVAAACVTTIIPTRPVSATFVTGGWQDYTAALDPLTVPVFTPRNPWAVVDFIGKGREQIRANTAAGDGLRDQLAVLLEREGLIPASTTLHTCGRGRAFRVAPTKITHRLNTAALREADPALYLALTTASPTPAKLVLKIGKITPDAFDLDNELGE